MNYAEHMAWLLTLVRGDKVAVKQTSAWRIYTIDRLTATQFIMGNGAKFKRKDGYRFGAGSWDFSRIEPIGKEAIESEELEARMRWLRCLDGKRPSLAVLRAMKAAHDKADAAEHGMIEVEQGEKA